MGILLIRCKFLFSNPKWLLVPPKKDHRILLLRYPVSRSLVRYAIHRGITRQIMIWINLTCLKRSTKFTRVIFPWPGKNTQSHYTRAKKIYQSTLIHGQKWFWVAFPSEYSILDKSSSPWWILLASKRSVFPHEFCQPKSYVFPSNRPWRICQGKLNSVNENYCSKDTTPFPSLPRLLQGMRSVLR